MKRDEKEGGKEGGRSSVVQAGLILNLLPSPLCAGTAGVCCHAWFL